MSADRIWNEIIRREAAQIFAVFRLFFYVLHVSPAAIEISGTSSFRLDRNGSIKYNKVIYCKGCGI